MPHPDDETTPGEPGEPGELGARRSVAYVLPVYNEAATITRAIEAVLAVDYPCTVELIVVDDGSADATAQLLAPFESDGVTVIRHIQNLGKGAAVRTGVERASGTHLIILDADLEYSPSDIAAMLVPLLSEFDVALGRTTMPNEE